jgi:Glycosyl transferase family 2
MAAQNIWGRLKWRFIIVILVVLAFVHFSLEYNKHGATLFDFHNKSEQYQMPPEAVGLNLTQTSVAGTPTTQSGSNGHAKPMHIHVNKPIVPGDDEEYMAICMVVKDQSLDLPEFFQHHYYNIGFRRFYIMDDGSNPPLSEIQDYGVPNEALTFRYYKPEEHSLRMQLEVYDNCSKLFGKNHVWMAYFDADEFLEQVTEVTLKEKLQELEKTDTIGIFVINWRMHTSSNIVNRPKDIRKSFLECIYDDPEHNGTQSDNRHVKSIVRTSKYKKAISPHIFNVVDDAHSVGEDGRTTNLSPFRQPITRKLFSLHHYAVKSYEEYLEKLSRGNAMSDPKTWDFWDHVRDIPHEPCEEMLKYFL